MENEPRSTATPPDAEPELAPITLADLPAALREAAARMGWKELMPVQARAIPYLRAGRDVMVQSRTGSGKTGAFLLPILERVDATLPQTQALILVPTRELARQVCQEAEALTRDLPVRATALYGGVGYGPQLQALRDGAHVVVATPGRILDHLVRGSLSLRHLRVLVFDEADRMLSVGFYPDIKALAEFLPRKRNGYMFSATYPPGVLALARQFLDHAETLNLSHGVEHVVETLQVYYEVPAMEKERTLVRIIEIENPESAIIFTNTKATANFVAVVLQRFGYDADRISSDLTQAAREQVLQRVYDKKLRFLVATDLAARGIDIEDLSHVFLYEFPEDPESYIHRVGRTGRAGAGGEAISLVDVLEKLRLKTVVARYGIDMQRRERPTDADVQKVVAERVTALLEAKLRGLDRLVLERMGRMLPLARTLAENDDEHPVIAMLLDEYYQQCLHAPPEPIPREAPALAPETAPGGGGGRRRRRRSRSR